MLEFGNVTLDDRETIEKYFKEAESKNSECTFTNLFMWREGYHIRWTEAEGCLIIVTTYGDETWAIQPVGVCGHKELENILVGLREYFQKENKPFVMRGLTPSFADRLEKEFPGWFWAEEERDLFDYIYRGDDLRQLKGKKYHGKRNHLNQFMKKYPEYTYEELSVKNKEETLEFLERWCRQRQCTGDFDQGLACEKDAIHEIMKNWDMLNCSGGVIRIGGRIEAFTIGEKLNSDMIVIHIEKANTEIHGLYGMIHREYLLHEWPDIDFVNREEDMGDEGLRKAKLSFYPVDFSVKIRAEYQEKDQIYYHKASEKDKETVRDLWTYCFTDTEDFVEWYFQKYYSRENTAGIYKNGKMMASAQTIPYEVMVQGERLKASYLVGLCTAPEYRRGRLAKKLLYESLKKMREEGRSLCLLMPFEGSFYYRYQWSFCYSKIRYEIKPEELLYAKKDYGEMEQVGMMDRRKEMGDIYDLYERNFSGYVCRSERQWELLCESWEAEKCHKYMLYHEEQPEGYLVYTLEPGVIRIQEMIYANEMAKAGMLDFLYGHRSQNCIIEWNASPYDTTYTKLCTPRGKSCMIPFLMARATDVEMFWKNAGDRNLEEPLYIRIQDRLLPWNDGCFCLRAEQGAAVSEKMQDADKWEYAMGIETFTMLMLGADSPENLVECGEITMRENGKTEILEKYFPKKRTDIQEYF